MQIQSIICDRLTITGRLDWTKERINSTGEWQRKSYVLSKLFNPIEWQIIRYPNIENGLYSDNFSVPIQESGSSIFIQVNRIHSNQRDFRVDFNPSKLNQKEKEWLLKILRRIKEKRATRVDMAANFYHELISYKLKDGRQRSSVEFKDRYGNIETLYRGSKNSSSYLKLYNKKKEQKAKYKEIDHPWWRIEETIKDDKANTWKNYDWFKGIQLISEQAVFSEDVSATDKAVALCVMNNLMSKTEFSKNYRSKIKSIIDSVTYEDGLNVYEEIKKAPYQQMLDGALKEIDFYLN